MPYRNSSADTNNPAYRNVIKEIEDGIVDLLKNNLSKNCKIVVDPSFELSTIKQNIIINLQYTGEAIESRAQSKINYTSLPRNNFIRSKVSYKLRLFFKEIRDSYDKVYDLLMELKSCLNGQKPVDDNDLTIGPISINNIDFIEKSSSGIIRYDLSLEITYVN